jgi:hypothetical protein
MTPVHARVASKCSGPPDILTLLVNGISIAGAGSAALAPSLTDLRERLDSAARRRFSDCDRVERGVADHERLYEEHFDGC